MLYRVLSSKRTRLLSLTAVATVLLVSAAVAQDPSTDARRTRLGGLLSSDPAHGRLDVRLDDKPWIPADWAAAPLSATISDQNLSMRASLVHWGEHIDWSSTKKIEELKALWPAGSSIRKRPPSTSAPFDVWSTVDVQGLDTDAAKSRRSSVGADYKLDRSTVIGAAVEMRDTTAGASGALAEGDTTVAAYAAMRQLQWLTLDARAAWGQTSTSLPGHAFAATQNVLAARARGNWSFSSIRFTPSVSIGHGIDVAEDTLVRSETVRRSTIAIVPRLSRPIALGQGQTLEPFVTYKRELDLGSALGAAEQSSETHRSAGAGMTLVQPGGLSLSVSGDVLNLGAPAPPDLKGQLQLKVPLR